ncbi:MAG: hypothetical protein HOP29_03560, partial [Phycisphaerales bacterium]|nr:hypothetical protein [Phycisphaerales bacterium]
CSCVAALAAAAGWAGCDSISQPEFVTGASVTDNVAPNLTIINPDANLSISQGANLVIEWIDTDRDDNARIAFRLTSVEDPSVSFPLVDTIEENGGTDQFTVNTQLLPLGMYNLRGTIDDGVNRAVSAVATNRQAGLGEVVIRIVPSGGTSISNLPPQVFVRDPAFNLSVSQDDVITVRVQPTSRDPNLDPQRGPIIDDAYDIDSTARLFIALDLDHDPLNDNVIAPTADELIVLVGGTAGEEIVLGDPAARTFSIAVDISRVPIREDGSPYRIRATISDGQNPPVHTYAAGTINVVRAAASLTTDLRLMGKTLSGATFRGFNPGARLSTRMLNIRDFDLDGVDDFALVARFGNPRNFGNIGEAYVIYGLPGQRFGGEINVNSTSTSVPGFIVEAPPPRQEFRCGGFINVQTPRTEGITDVSFIPDLDGDNRPEIMVGCAHVDGVATMRDDDPGDNAPSGDETVAVDISLRQGTSELTEEAEPDDIQIDFAYFQMEDLVIDEAEPNTNFRSADLSWMNAGAGTRRWSMVKFRNVLQQFPDQDTPDRVQELSGDMTFRVLDPGGRATVHELFRDFNEAGDTFNSFGAPVPIIDYDEDELGTINADDSGAVSRVDIAQLLQRLLFGGLGASNNEIRLIFVPGDPANDEEAMNPASVASKEFGLDERDRPTIEISYERELLGSALGCYPDRFPNNFSDRMNLDNGCNERKFEALGFVTVISSTNRDAAVRVDPERLDEPLPDRLENTVVSLEVVGMRPADSLEFEIAAFATAIGREAGRTGGWRATPGQYDFFDDKRQGQPPLQGLFGQNVSWMPDINLDGFAEIVISSPRNERDYLDSLAIPGSTHEAGRIHYGSITVIPGGDHDVDTLRDKSGATTGTSSIPFLGDTNDTTGCETGQCPTMSRCDRFGVIGTWEIFAEGPDDLLGGASSPGDFNLDAVPDMICGAPRNDRSVDLADTGAMYVIYGRSPVGSVFLNLADDPDRRAPMLRVRGERPGDQIGWRQVTVSDVNGDGIDDVLFSSPSADFIVPRPECSNPDFEGALSLGFFNACRDMDEVFMDDTCKNFDYNNDRVVNDDDRDVFDCLVAGGTDCCPVDNGYAGVIFGGTNRRGDRVISQLGTEEFGGVAFYGSNAGDRAGYDVSSAGDFDKDGFGDILISAPGETRTDVNGRLRMGVTYLVFGGPHLETQEVPIELSEVGDRVQGMIFLSPYPAGAPDEAPTDFVGFLGDINDDGFGDIAIGVSMADLIDPDFPQGGGSSNETGRLPNQGDAYLVYGNNIGQR